jgi:hypothetical protein
MSKFHKAPSRKEHHLIGQQQSLRRQQSLDRRQKPCRQQKWREQSDDKLDDSNDSNKIRSSLSSTDFPDAVRDSNEMIFLMLW